MKRKNTFFKKCPRAIASNRLQWFGIHKYPSHQLYLCTAHQQYKGTALSGSLYGSLFCDLVLSLIKILTLLLVAVKCIATWTFQHLPVLILRHSVQFLSGLPTICYFFNQPLEDVPDV